MNRIAGLLVSASLLVLVTGCSSFIDPVPKNIYMVKKYNAGNKDNETSIPGGMLSVATIKSIGLSAVEKYFGNTLSPDNAQIEVSAVDLNALKELVEHDIRPDDKLDAEAKLKKVPEGLFYLTISSANNERYALVLNAGSGDVLKISNETQTGVEGIDDPGDRTGSFNPEVSYKFLQEKEALNPKDFRVDRGMFIEAKEAAYYYFISMEDNSLKYLIEVDLTKNKVKGFSKDIMALLTWNGKVFAKLPIKQE
ncbi:hypothetical protein M3194_17675 [Paenibacillus glycanilyticus]|uniref:hypothetical protein n=1 Tax=Paenibacillus glycanilyticus TaxID=126569 RepID=UPI00203C49A5|nr:hypothetical protein [Paenibacillus glycanilyticus]MCM3629176.1 hypothetical protein [Paenibacillus glycanilyticus]